MSIGFELYRCVICGNTRFKTQEELYKHVSYCSKARDKAYREGMSDAVESFKAMLKSDADKKTILLLLSLEE